jgi:hypothetical protein
MPKHTWSFSVKSDAGSGPVDTLVVAAPAEINVGNSGVSTCQVGVQDVVQVAINVTIANIQSFFMEADTDVRVRINSETVPAQEFNLLAKKALGWNNADLPHGFVNPLTTNITSLFIYNLGTVNGVVPTAGLKVANFQAGFLLNQDTVTS